jgi:hypothetical protein
MNDKSMKMAKKRADMMEVQNKNEKTANNAFRRV